jgi:hypothetical protein
MENVDLSSGLLVVAVKHDPKQCQRTLPTAVVEPSLALVSTADGTWRFTLTDPGTDAWKSLPFDDRSWPSLTAMTPPQLRPGDIGAYQCRHCLDQGAALLGLPDAAPGEETASWLARLFGRRAIKEPARTGGGIWIRRVFEITAPLFGDPGS